MRRIPVCSTMAALAGFLLMTSAAQAQTPPAEAGAPSSSTATASFTGASSVRGRGIGVGVGTLLNGTTGLMGTWGAGAFHVDGIFGLHRYVPNGNATTSFTVAGRFWYHVHAASFADFSLGGGIGLLRWVSDPGMTGPGPRSDTHWDVSMELGGQIRAFIVPNVALLADVGLGMTFGNNDDILIGGQSASGSAPPEGAPQFLVGTLGIAYFFE
jgi:hypothetical protein